MDKDSESCSDGPGGVPPEEGATWVEPYERNGVHVSGYWRSRDGYKIDSRERDYSDAGFLEKLSKKSHHEDPVDDEDKIPIDEKRIRRRKDGSINFDKLPSNRMNFGESAEIVANLGIISGTAEYDPSMPYGKDEVEFIEISGVDSEHRNWSMRVHTDGFIKGPYPGQSRRLTKDQLSEISNYSTLMSELLNARNEAAPYSDKASRIAASIRRILGKKNIRDSDLNTDELREMDRSRKDCKHRADWIRWAALERAYVCSSKVSEILGVPEGKMIKSIGEKSDVKIGIKGSGQGDVDLVSTKGFLNGSPPSLFSANGSSSGEVDLVLDIPAAYRNDRDKLVKRLDYANKMLGTHNAKKVEYLKRMGIRFTSDNAVIRNKKYEQSVIRIGNELGADARKGLIETAVARANGVSDPNQLPKDIRNGFMAVGFLRGSTEYNPSDAEVYDPGTTRKINTYAEVSSYKDGKSSDAKPHTTIIRRNAHEQMEWLLKHGSITESNAGPRRNGKIQPISNIVVKGDKIIYPVNLGLNLGRNMSSL